jgi:AraC family transcriptional regulator of adaptative response / DNA-3-methyladenine glycosylase II
MPPMELDHAACYRAIRSRDPRFDGRFFTAVRSTGVYCRPICPARTPLARNVRFFACAAAAEAAGFRPCRRCRPETSPGTPGWMGASATVARALRLIEQGGLDHESLERFARRLGVGPRHLRRLFLAHLGAPPVAVARTRRAHFARRLLDETRLPIGEVAFAAGYESVRQFNHDVRELFRMTPTDLRRAAPEPAEGNGALVLRLPLRPPYDWRALAGFLAARAVPGIERVQDGIYRRTFRTRGGPGVIEVTPDRDGWALRLGVVRGGTADLLEIVRGTRRLFDLDADPATIAARLSSSARLRRAVAAGPRGGACRARGIRSKPRCA